MRKARAKTGNAKGMIFMTPEHPIVESMVFEGLDKYINDVPESGYFISS